MIPEDNPFAIPADSPPEVIDLPSNFAIPLDALVDTSWNLKVEDDNQLEKTEVDFGAASSFLSYIEDGGDVQIIFDSTKVEKAGTFPIRIKLTDDWG